MPRINEEFKSCRVVDVKKEVYPSPEGMHGYEMDLLCQTLEEASNGIDRMVGKSAGDELRSKLAAAYEEHRLYGSLIEADIIVCVGKKAG